MPRPNRVTPPSPYEYLAAVPSFPVTSTDLTDGAPIDRRFVADADFGLDGDNVSPHLAWDGFPVGTLSFAVTCFDPDAPTASGFWHWVLVDIPATVTELATGAASGDLGGLPPGAVHIGNDTTNTCYTGPFPPTGHGPHRYVFAVHALSVASLGLDASVRPAVVGFTMADLTVGRGLLTATYEIPA